VWTLRISRPRLASSMTKLLCYFGRHRWQKKRDDEGSVYHECRRCGKWHYPSEYPTLEINPADFGGGGGGGGPM
jgi:hypothetical protein